MNWVLVGWLETVLVSTSYPNILGETFNIKPNWGNFRRWKRSESESDHTSLHNFEAKNAHSLNSSLAFIFNKFLKTQEQVYTCLNFKSINIEA
jgi:hypothetical protein